MDLAEKSRRAMSAELEPTRRARLGQYFTPKVVSRQLAAMLEQPGGPTLRLLDPGAGTGILTAAVVERVLENPGWNIAAIHADAYEIDETLHASLRTVLDASARFAEQSGITFTWKLIEEDFVLATARTLGTLGASEELYDAVVANPPYKKISTSSATRRAAEDLGVPVVNIYSAFLVAAISRLRDHGQLIAITPRSFTNGPYHRPFREFFFDRMSFEQIHIYASRDLAFADADVLQENILFGARRCREKPSVTLSFNDGPGQPSIQREVAHSAVVNPLDPSKFIHLPVGHHDSSIASRMESLPCALSDLGLSVSTGRVVDFRSKEFLRSDPEPGSVPLLYPLHLVDGLIEWPKPGARKPNALARTPKTEKLLLPNEPYVLVKRFSSKEATRRINAGVLFPELIPSDVVAIENHVNVFHVKRRGLARELAVGLAIFLSCSIVDHYIRQFNGHTQINATDLRQLRYPTAAQLERVGARGAAVSLSDQNAIDSLITSEVHELSDDSSTVAVA